MLSYLNPENILVFPRIKEVLGHYFPVIRSLSVHCFLSAPPSFVSTHWQYPFIGSVIDPDSSETVLIFTLITSEPGTLRNKSQPETAISGEAPCSLSLSSRPGESVLNFSNLNAALLI